MTKESYEKCMSWTQEHIGIGTVRLLVKLFTAITVVLYGAVVLLLMLRSDVRIWRVLLIPAAGFLAVTFLRRAVGAKRPYEVYGFVPLLQKDSKGNSFPSRHVFSNMIIAMAVCSVYPLAGGILLVCGMCLAVLRVVAGVHYPRDVAAGMLFAILLGIAGFYVF